MSDDRRPVFLERQVYRRRRLIDAAKLLPILGACLFLVPVLVLNADAPSSTATRLVYFFVAWGALIAVAYVISRRLARSTPDQGE